LHVHSTSYFNLGGNLLLSPLDATARADYRNVEDFADASGCGSWMPARVVGSELGGQTDRTQRAGADGFSGFMRDALKQAGSPHDGKPHGLRKTLGRATRARAS
jgi:hypothetical protein